MVDASYLREMLEQVAECSTRVRACHEVADYEDEPATVSRYTRLLDLLREQRTLAQRAHAWIVGAVCARPLSARVRDKFYGGGGTPIVSRGLGEFLQLLDDHADALPLFFSADSSPIVPSVDTLFRRYETRHRNTSASRPYKVTPRRKQNASPQSPPPLPPLVGATPLPEEDPIPVGALVAAWDERQGDQESKWILAEVLEHKNNNDSYTLLDHMAEFEYHKQLQYRGKSDSLSPPGMVARDNNNNAPFVLRDVCRRNLRPLPRHRAHPRLHPNALFGPGVLVIARFPQTTVFYRACVLAPPSGPRDGYRVTFDLDAELDLDSYERDSSMTCYTIPQLYVVQEPPGHNRHSRWLHKA